MKRIIAEIRTDKIRLYTVSDAYILRCSDEKKEINERLDRYLNASTYISILLDTAKDLFSGKQIKSEETWISDGTWVWSADLLHYYRHHNFQWPENMIHAIKDRDYFVPVLTDDHLLELECVTFDIKRSVFKESWHSSNEIVNQSPVLAYDIHNL